MADDSGHKSKHEKKKEKKVNDIESSESASAEVSNDKSKDSHSQEDQETAPADVPVKKTRPSHGSTTINTNLKPKYCPGDVRSIELDFEGLVASYRSCLVKRHKRSKHEIPRDIKVDRFLTAFYDLMPVMRLLGTAFYFVEKDIVQKLTAIQANQDAQPDNKEVKNLIDFIQWEKENDTVRTKHSTGRHALRLIRALHFISLFLDKLNDPEVEPKPAAKEAYEKSLAMFHPWSVRTAVSVAFYTLPNRKNFLHKLKLDAHKEGVFVEFVAAMNDIRDTLNLYYDANGYQDLP